MGNISFTGKIKAAWSQFFNAGTSTLADPSTELIEGLMGIPASAGKVVSHRTAIRVAAVLSCVRVMANDIAKMPLVLREQVTVNKHQRTKLATDNPLYSIFMYVSNRWQTSYELRWFLAAQLIMQGNSYCQKIVDQKGDVTELIPLDAWSMEFFWDADAPLVNAWGAQITKINPVTKKKDVAPAWRYYGTPGRVVTFYQPDLWHVAAHNLEGVGLLGSSMILLCKEAISLLIAAEETAGRQFVNGLGMGGFITFPPDQSPDEKQAQNIVNDLQKNFAQSKNAGKFSVIPFGGKFEKMTWNAKESQLLDSRQWNEQTIARAFGGAPLIVKLGLSKENATYASSSAFLEEYFNTTIAPLATAIEQSISRDLIDPEDRGKLYVKHNADIFLRGSPRERAETYQIKINSFQMTPNMALALEDQDTIEGADFLSGGTGTPVIFDVVNQRFFIPGQLQPMLTDDESEQKKALTPPPPTLVQSQEPDAEGEDQDEDGAELQVPPAKKGKKALPKPNKTKNRLEDIANSLVERVFRKEQKSGSIDTKFVAEVLNVSMEKAEEYVAKRPSQNEMEARAALFVLAMGE